MNTLGGPESQFWTRANAHYQRHKWWLAPFGQTLYSKAKSKAKEAAFKFIERQYNSTFPQVNTSMPLFKRKKTALTRRRPYRRTFRRRTRFKKRYAIKRNRRTGKRTITRRKGKLSKIRTQVRKLQRQNRADLGVAIHRTRTYNSFGCSDSKSYFHDLAHFGNDECEASISYLRYYNPSDPANLVTADGAVGTYKKDFNFVSVVSTIQLTNNYKTPGWVTLYLMIPKEDTNQSPRDMYVAGLTDVGNPNSDLLSVYPTDSKLLSHMYSFARTKRYYVRPGQTITQSYKPKPFLYDPSLQDSHTLQFFRRHGAHYWCARMEGHTAHDRKVGTEFGTGACQFDTVHKLKTVIQYTAGVNVTTITVGDNSKGVFTNAPVSTVVPAPFNVTGHAEAGFAPEPTSTVAAYPITYT